MIDQKLIIQEEYKHDQHNYEEFTKKIHKLIESLLTESNIRVHSLDKRTKDVKSLEEKLKRKGDSYNKLADITDLSGIRIICYLLTEVEEVANVIEQNFTILRNLSVDKKKLLDPDKFGYLSLHYIVKLSESRNNLAEYRKYKDFVCEIQIRTILQHSWAEIEHDIGYKSTFEIPRDMKRRFFRLSSILELADDEFINLKTEIERYSRELNSQAIERNDEIYIDAVSLDKYLSTNLTIQKLNKNISKIWDVVYTDIIYSYRTDMRILSYFGINKIHELNKLIIENEDKIMFFARTWRKKKTDIQLSNFEKDISILYLGYILICDKNENYDILNYLLHLANLEYHEVANFHRYKDWANEIKDCYEEYLRDLAIS